MYKLVTGRFAYENGYANGAIRAYAANLFANPLSRPVVRDRLICLDVPDEALTHGRIITLGEEDFAHLMSIVRDYYGSFYARTFTKSGLGGIHPEYYPDWRIVVPHDIIGEESLSYAHPLEVEGGIFIAAYNEKHNMLYAADIVHNISQDARGEAVRAFVDFLRSIGVPIPLTPTGEDSSEVYAAFPGGKITFGADPEFELLKGRRIIRASSAISRSINLPGGEIGVDGAGGPLELRPSPSEDPAELVANVGKLLLSVPKLVGGVPSTMCELMAIGGHVHIGFSEKVAEYSEDIVRAIDGELGGLFEGLNSRVRRESSYGRRGDWRSQSWGVEYRTPPAAIWSHPEAAMAFLSAIAHIVRRLVHNGYWDPNKDPLWGEIKERARKAAGFVQKYDGRLHWGAWKRWVGDFNLINESTVEVDFSSVTQMDEQFVDDMRIMLIRLGLPRVSIFPLKRDRGDYASNVRGYGVLADTVEFLPELTLALSWRFRNDPEFRRAEMPKLQEAIARLLEDEGDDGNRLIKECISLEGEWPNVPEAAPITEEGDDEEDYVECTHCGRRTDADSVLYDRYGDAFCEMCYHDIYTVCDSCEREILRDDALYYGDYAYCEGCYHDHYATCDNCEEDYPIDDVDIVSVRYPDGTIAEMNLCTHCRGELDYDEENGVYLSRR